jgi:hypothetical protein
MPKKYITRLFVCFIFFFLTANIHAWDGKRKDLVLGYGIGLGITSFTLEVPGYDVNDRYIGIVETARENYVGLAFDLKVGFAPDNLWGGILYYEVVRLRI